MLEHIPTSVEEIKLRGWDYVDIILFTGDAYVDHPSFGVAIIARIAEYLGCRVVVVPQPNWQDDLRDFKKFGRPRYFFGVTSGNMDSMVNHYTARKRKRSNDAYTPGGRAGARPDYAATVYSNILKKLYPDVPIVLGGIEASLRRLTHYDYWSNTLKPPILIESQADLLLYGMCEFPFIELVKNFQKNQALNKVEKLPQSCYVVESKNINRFIDNDTIVLPSYEECLKSKNTFLEFFRIVEQNSSSLSSKRLIQQVGDKIVVVEPPYRINSSELDFVYSLPYTRKPHPRYRKKPPIPAYEMIKNSVTIHRGCFGGCSFCTLNVHQGKFIISRSEKSILDELKKIAGQDDFKGHITDLGGPTANMYLMGGIDKSKCSICKRPSCLFPHICNNLCFDHAPLINLYEKAKNIPGIKKITIGSGIRYDLLVVDEKILSKNYNLKKYTELLIKNHVSGRLKVAPEHFSDKILKLMRKPSFDTFLKFYRIFMEINKKYNLHQELSIYLIHKFPSSSEKDDKKLIETTKKMGFIVESIQDYTPTPMTYASVLYYLQQQ